MTEVRMTRRRTFLRAAVSSPVFVGAACAGATRPGERSTSVPSDSAQVDATLIGGPLTAPAEGPIRVAFLASQGTELVDLAGPWGVFTYAAGPHAAATFETYVVAERMEPLEFSGGLRVLPRYTLEDAPAAHVVIIPAQADPTPKVVAWLRAAADTADLVVSVCTGAFVLGAAGLLSGRRATTHHGALTLLAADYPEATIIRGARFVDDGKISSAGGLTSGIDVALHVVERYFGRAAALEAADQLEHQGRGWMNPSSNEAYRGRPRLTGHPPRCPVCEGVLSPDGLAAAPRRTHGGKVYFFCGDRCLARFEQTPAAFAEED